MVDERLPRHMEGEMETLLGTLEYLRRSLKRNLDGLDDDDLRRSPVPSGTNLIGLIQHVDRAEIFWMVHVYAGLDDDVPPPTMEVGDRRSDDVLQSYRSTAERVAQIASAGDLDGLSARPGSDGDRVTLRWILIHLIEELARHAGHADIIREQIDGAVGR